METWWVIGEAAQWTMVTYPYYVRLRGVPSLSCGNEHASLEPSSSQKDYEART